MIASAKKAEAVVQLKMVAGEAVIFLEYAPDFLKTTIAEQSVCRGEICRKMMKAMDAEDAMFAAAALAGGGTLQPSSGLAFAGLHQTSETPACGRCPGSSFFEAVLEEVAPKGAVIIVEDEEAVVIVEDEEAVVIVEEDNKASRLGLFCLM